MHCCGSPLHDVPANLPLILPVLAPLLLWLRAYAFGKKPHVHNGDCNH
jgi:hypothetical protein